MGKYFRVREIAEEKGYNPTNLARKADLVRNAVVPLWEDNAKANPTRQTLEKIANALEVTVADLLGTELGGKMKAALVGANC